jgi:tetratricopeptide (TPR) repeat protein
MDEEEDARKAELAATQEIEALLAQGRAAEAAAAANRALGRSSSADRPHFQFLLASALSLEGSHAAALQALEQADVPASAPYRAEYTLLKARLLLEGQSYREALALFDDLLRGAPASATAQPAWFLSAFCSLQLGERAETRRRLEKARDLDPGSDLGIKAKEMLGSL